MSQLADATPAPVAGATLFGQPRGLATLFLTEMWERFTYYGIQAVLILFMVAAAAGGGLGLDDRTASSIYGLFLGSTYLLGLLGGWMADRLLGAQRAVVSGGVFITIGNLLLAFGSTALFFVGLLVIALGIGLLKPNVSALVAALYPEGGSRRDAGFSIFYMGINSGAFLGALIVPEVADKLGWRRSAWRSASRSSCGRAATWEAPEARSRPGTAAPGPRSWCWLRCSPRWCCSP
jgi:proton-dependent oligopeptide transporter, POT family